jgi:hypothetical protein
MWEYVAINYKVHLCISHASNGYFTHRKVHKLRRGVIHHGIKLWINFFQTKPNLQRQEVEVGCLDLVLLGKQCGLDLFFFDLSLLCSCLGVGLNFFSMTSSSSALARALAS